MAQQIASDQEIFEGIAWILKKRLDYEGEVRPDLRLVDDVRLDSVRLLTLVVEMEDRFRICLEDGDEAGVVTVADLVEVVRGRLAG